MPPNSGTSGSKNEDDLDRRAAEAILLETKRASTRAESFGSTAWKPSPIPKPNKIFLTKAIGGTLMQNAFLHNNRSASGSKTKSDFSGSSKKRDRSADYSSKSMRESRRSSTERDSSSKRSQKYDYNRNLDARIKSRDTPKFNRQSRSRSPVIKRKSQEKGHRPKR